MIHDIRNRRPTPMRPSPRRLAAKTSLGWAVVAMSIGPAIHAAPVPRGPEVPLDPLADSYLDCPELAGRDDGSFAAMWARLFAPDGTADVLVRAGNALGALGPVRSGSFESLLYVRRLRLASTPAGYTALAANFDLVFARELDADGERLGEPIDLSHRARDVSPRRVGGFAALFQAWPWTLLSLLDSFGEAPRAPARVSPRAAGNISAAHEADGGLSVLWEEILPSGLEGGLVSRRYGAFGRPLGPPRRLVAQPGAKRTIEHFETAVGDDGTLAVAWISEPLYRAGPDLLLLRTFDPLGRPLQPPLLVASDVSTPYVGPWPLDLAVDDKGTALLLWSTNEGYVFRTRALVLPRAALAAEPFEIVSAASAGFEEVFCASVAAAGDSWVIAWHGRDPSRQPGDQLFVRRFAR